MTDLERRRVPVNPAFKCTEPGCQADALRFSEGIKCSEHSVTQPPVISKWDMDVATAIEDARREAFAEAAEIAEAEAEARNCSDPSDRAVGGRESALKIAHQIRARAKEKD